MSKNNLEKNEIEKVQDFLKKNGSTKWKTFQTGSRCEGFTLAYGAFYTMNSDLIKQHTIEKLMNESIDQSEDNIADYEYDSKHEIIKEWQSKYPELNFYLLPCCWPGETKFDFFVGFNIYPLLWTKRRHYVDNFCLQSAMDDWIMSAEEKNKILDKLKNLEQYKAPDFLKTNYIFDMYCHMDSWRNSLYLKNYPEIFNWLSMLDNLYQNEIASKTIAHQKFLVNELIHKPNFEWVFLPSDCASCS